MSEDKQGCRVQIQPLGCLVFVIIFCLGWAAVAATIAFVEWLL